MKRAVLGVAIAWTVLAGVAFAQQPVPAPAPQSTPNPQMAAAQASFEALPETERRAIQTDLIWAGLFNGAASGSFGALTFRGINALKAKTGGAPDGVLKPAERRALAEQAQAARTAAGFQIVSDKPTGIRIGIPTRVLPKTSATPAGGSRWQSVGDKVTLDLSAGPSEPLEALFDKAVSANVPGRKITYKLLRPDFFVITGETATGKFYRRLAAGPDGLRGFSIGYDKAMAGTIDKLVIAIAASFEPFPSGPAPAATPAIAAPLQPPRPANERYGVAVAISDRLALTAPAVLSGCRSLRVAGRPAKARADLATDGLAVVEIDGAKLVAVPAARSDATSLGESVVLLAYGDDAGKRMAQALTGAMVAAGDRPAVSAPLQPGQAGSPVFDRQGRLLGLVTADPSDKMLVAGIAPARSHAMARVDAVVAKAGVTPIAGEAGAALSTGALVEKRGGSVLPVVCGI